LDLLEKFEVDFTLCTGLAYGSGANVQAKYKGVQAILHAVAQLVEALRYKPEGRGFDCRCCHWNFSLT
jgi:hypothetical protein